MKNTAPPIKICDRDLLRSIQSLIENNKRCDDSNFRPLRAKHSGRPNDFVDVKPLAHSVDELNDFLEVTVEVNVVDYSNFKFRLTSDQIYFPFFRYDSTGRSHRNRHIPLGKGDMIPCPHFNTYNQDGYNIAYRTNVIEKQEQFLQNPEFALKHFFIEGNVNSGKNNPKVELDSKLFSEVPLNPIEGIHFK